MKMYNPLTKKEAQEKANRLSALICRKCPNDLSTGCKDCIFYALFLAMIGNEEF
jgi:hypothetical protein